MQEGRRGLLGCLVFLLCAICRITSSSAESCPQQCSCHVESDEDLRVSCSGIQITEIPDGIPHNTTKLDLQDTSIMDIPSGKFDNLTNLAILDMKGSKVASIDTNAFLHQGKIKELVLERNEFISVPSECFSKIPTLNKLLLNHNRIVAVHNNAFSELAALLHLDLEFNNISQLFSHSFDGLPALLDLKLNNNRILSLPNNIFSVTGSLSDLTLSNNQLEKLTSSSFGTVSNLQKLNLAGNHISSIECATFTSVPKLEELYLGSNELNQVPNPCVLSPLTTLKTLDLSYNKIGSVPSGAFSSNPALGHLMLNGMKSLLSVDIYAFEGLESLTALSLHSNPNLTEFTHTHLPSDAHPGINQLLLHSNGFTQMQQEVFTSHQKLLKATLHGNPLHCNCSLKWIARIIQDAGKPTWAHEWTMLAGSPQCQTPPNMQNAMFKDLAESDLTCDKPEINPVSDVKQTVIRGESISIIAQAFPGQPCAVWNNPQGQALSPGYISAEGRIVVRSELLPDHKLKESYYISNVTSADGGLYTLEVENAGGKNAFDFQLEVKDPPLMTSTTPVTSGAQKFNSMFRATTGILLLFMIFLHSTLEHTSS